MKIGIIGFGGVGKALVELLENKKTYLSDNGIDLSVNFILNSRGGIYNPKGIDCKDLLEFVDANGDLSKYSNGGKVGLKLEELLEYKDIDILIEITPTNKETGEPAKTYIKSALNKGINVVTANKGPIVVAYKELKNIAKKNNVQLALGCTTGGALPSINGGLFDMAGAEILSIQGIFNGTTNYIIEQMENKNISYEDALKNAQIAGIAETNPSLDVEGWDSAIKLLILTNILMNQDKKLDDIDVSGIEKLTIKDIQEAKKNGQKYKLIGESKKIDGEVKSKVKLQKIDSNSMLFNVDGKNKAVKYNSNTLGELTFIGGASGVTPAAASIFRDLVNIYKGYKFI